MIYQIPFWAAIGIGACALVIGHFLGKIIEHWLGDDR